MASKSNKAFSLLEVIITVAILSTAIVFLFRAFTTVLASVRFSQNITLVCLLAEDKLWRLENKFPVRDSTEEEKLEDNKFEWHDEITNVDEINLAGLKLLTLTVSWEEKRQNPYSLIFSTYLYLPDLPKSPQ